MNERLLFPTIPKAPTEMLNKLYSVILISLVQNIVHYNDCVYVQHCL